MKHTTPDLLIRGGNKLSGTIKTKPSKNGSVALLCAALINGGETRLRNIVRIEETKRLIEVLRAIGVSVVEEEDGTVTVTPPDAYTLKGLEDDSFTRIRSGLMLIPAIAHRHPAFRVPAAGGCRMGTRSITAHTHGLAKLGIIADTDGTHTTFTKKKPVTDTVVMREASDTGTVNLLLAAALTPRKTTITFASANYQVQEVCFFLRTLGIRVNGIGTATLHVYGTDRIDRDIEYTNSEDPTESMAYIAIAATTNSRLTITRAPIDFLTPELLTLECMGLAYGTTGTYTAENGETKLTDITIRESDLRALPEKIHAVPYPGINTDNLPFFVPIATRAEGTTLIHDWMWENRAIYYTEINRLGADITLLDPHRATVRGITPLRGAQAICPPALRPSMILLVAMLAAEGESVLRETYSIHRGYENIVQRLRSIGADITVLE